ncbi:DUF742 domain-containing protein [Streptomyces sulphureus]|uniref:DUF742 domain-containing protein n=1 Tax=Streptomyces sulphureus TaxID=47758 RepID=UPI00036518B1|nr:DUF742 domain-containing protein [Streptomyces sulphureus]
MTAGEPGRPQVPGYVHTTGRTDIEAEIGWSLETLLRVTSSALPLNGPLSSRSHRRLLSDCAGLTSVVEAAAHLRQPVSVVRVLAEELVASGHLAVPTPHHPTRAHDSAPSRELLQEVLDGLRNHEFA